MTAHAEFLRVAAGDEELAARVKRGWREAPLAPRERALCAFVETLTIWPAELRAADFDALRAEGFGELEVLHAVLGCAHFNYLNRMADALGIRFEYRSELPPFEALATARPARASAPELRAPSESAAWLSLPPDAPLELAPHEPVRLFAALAHLPAVRDLVRAWRAHHLAGTPRLGERMRARLAFYACGLVRAAYPAAWHARRAASLGVGAAELERLAEAELPRGLDAREAFLFEHARRIALEPWLCREEHVVEQRRLGLDERDVVQLAMLIAYLSFEVRVALGLGLALEPEVQRASAS